MSPRPTRFIPRFTTAIIACVALALSGCAATDAEPGAAEASATTWSFTDDVGKTVTLDQRPTKIAGLSDVLFSMVNYGLQPVASFGYSSLKDDPRFKDLDTTGIVELGAVYGEINLEGLAAAAPDVIVTHAYPTDASGKIDSTQPFYGFKDLAQQEQAEKIAPIITIAMAGSASDVITRTTELAVALGVSPDSGPVKDGKAAFEAASTALTQAAANGVRTQVMYAEAANVYVAKAADDPSLRLYQSLGMTFVTPKTKDYYWDIIGWEDYDTVGGDLVLYSERGFGPDQLKKQPTFAATAAAKADQVHPWVFAGMDYVSQAAYLEQLAGFVGSSKKLG